MKPTRPRVFKIAETTIIPAEITKMLEHIGGNSEYMRGVLQGDQGGQALIEVAGRMCYESYDLGLNPNITRIRTDSSEYIRNLLLKAEGSVLEHSYTSWALLGISRVCSHEIVRHRVGTAISQESLRYVRPRDIKFWIPDELEEAQRASMAEAVEDIERAYRKLESTIPWDKLPMDAKKRLTSAIRRILPDGIATNMVWTANHRTLRWVIEMRTDPAAEVEIRMVFDQIAEICKRDYPRIYQDFQFEKLPDGTRSWRPTLKSKV